jgi:hypothetical protein
LQSSPLPNFRFSIFDFRLLVLFALLCGCDLSDGPIVSQEEVGSIVAARALPANESEVGKTEITTTVMMIVMCSRAPVALEKQAKILTFKSGRKFITWEGAPNSYLIAQ